MWEDDDSTDERGVATLFHPSSVLDPSLVDKEDELWTGAHAVYPSNTGWQDLTPFSFLLRCAFLAIIRKGGRIVIKLRCTFQDPLYVSVGDGGGMRERSREGRYPRGTDDARKFLLI